MNLMIDEDVPADVGRILNRFLDGRISYLEARTEVWACLECMRIVGTKTPALEGACYLVMSAICYRQAAFVGKSALEDPTSSAGTASAVVSADTSAFHVEP